MGGHKKVAMSDLRALADKLGFANARTLLQSGNLVFSARKAAPALEVLLEKEAAAQLGLETRVFVRSADEWRKVVAGNPFAGEARRDPSHLALMLLKHPVSKAQAAKLRESIVGREYFEARGRELYACFPDGFANSKFTTALIDRKLETTVTARNWNTVLKLAAAVA